MQAKAIVTDLIRKFLIRVQVINLASNLSKSSYVVISRPTVNFLQTYNHLIVDPLDA